jgi:thymidylate synthase (FAD)
MVLVQVIYSTLSPEQIIEYAYLQCHNHQKDIPLAIADKEQSERIVNALRAGHHSVLEHSSITFAISGISRACSHQIVRHRIGVAISQMSMRSTETGNEGSIVIPDSIDSDDSARGAYLQVLGLGQACYQALQSEKGIPMEDARFALGIATKTEMVMTFNARSLLHFLRLRLSKHAHWEIREVAKQMWGLAREWSPTVFAFDNRQYWACGDVRNVIRDDMNDEQRRKLLRWMIEKYGK